MIHIGRCFITHVRGMRNLHMSKGLVGLTKAVLRRLSYTSKDKGSKGTNLPCSGHTIEPDEKPHELKQ
jgi:hypothetical protein